MFRTGSKIIIVASSKKKGIGPKRGSEGYIGRRHITPAQLVFINYGIAASVFDVFFSRYGFEKKTRCEAKKMILVFPIINNNIGDTKAQVKSLVKRICSPKSNDMWNNVRHKLSCGSQTQIAIGVPSLNTITDLNKVSILEFTAWVESIVSDAGLLHFISSVVTDRRHLSSSDQILGSLSRVNELKSLFFDRSFKWKILAAVEESDQTRRSLIESLTMFLSFKRGDRNSKRRIESSVSSLQEIYLDKEGMTKEEARGNVYDLATRYAFENEMLNIIIGVNRKLTDITKLAGLSVDRADRMNKMVEEEIDGIRKLSGELLGFSSRLLGFRSGDK